MGTPCFFKITDDTKKEVAVVSELSPSVSDADWKNYTNAPTSILTIPEKVTYNEVEYSVTSIGDNAFLYCNGLDGSLTIGDGVTSIGSGAFEGCSGFTGSLAFGDGVTSIGNRAFWGCRGFTGSLTIPNSVTSIGEEAFCGCSGFTGSLTIPNSIKTIGEEAFDGCSGFTGSLIFGDGVASIGEYAFEDCSGITEIESLSSTPPTLGEAVFDYATLNRNGIKLSVPTDALSNYQTAEGWKEFDFINKDVAQITSTTTDGHELLYNIISEADKTVNLVGFADADNKGSGSLTIPEKVNYNGSDYTVTSIGWCAFAECDGFTGSLIIPNSVVSIEYGAFVACYGFTGLLTIPAGVTSIEDVAFAYCENFTGTLTIPEGVTSIGESAFDGCSGFTGSLTIPDGVVSIGVCAFYECSGFTGTLTIPDGVTSIEEEAFYGCSGFTDVTVLSTTVPTVWPDAFNGLAADIEVTVPSGSKTIYDTDTQYSSYDADWNEVFDVAGDNMWCGMTIVEGAATSIKDTQAPAPFTQVGNTLCFSKPTAVAVYNLSGVMLYSSTTTEYTLPSRTGIYVVCTEVGSYKVMSR